MATKVKGILKPKLHPLDKTVYALIIVFSIFLCFIFAWVLDLNEAAVAEMDLSNPNVIAYSNGNEGLAADFIYFLGLLPFWAGIRLWKRIGLFKPLQYAEKHRTAAYPERKNSSLRICVNVLMVVMLIVSMYFILTKDYSRWVMENNGTVTEYSAKNELVNTFELDPNHAEKVNFAVSSGHRGGRKTIIISVEFEDGKKFKMDKRNFINVDTALEFMEVFKAGLNDDADLIIKGKTWIMKDFIKQNHIQDPQADRWYALFEMSR